MAASPKSGFDFDKSSSLCFDELAHVCIHWRAEGGRFDRTDRGWNGAMERFCDELRWERERRQVSIEKISDETKVSSRHLQALEAGEYGALPGGVFRKGIVRSYLAAGRAVGTVLNTVVSQTVESRMRINPGTLVRFVEQEARYTALGYRPLTTLDFRALAANPQRVHRLAG